MLAIALLRHIFRGFMTTSRGAAFDQLSLGNRGKQGMGVNCSNLVDLLAVSLGNQHLGGLLFGDKTLEGVG